MLGCLPDVKRGQGHMPLPGEVRPHAVVPPARSPASGGKVEEAAVGREGGGCGGGTRGQVR
jgi:hypothetical protein